MAIYLADRSAILTNDIYTGEDLKNHKVSCDISVLPASFFIERGTDQHVSSFLKRGYWYSLIFISHPLDITKTTVV